MPKRASRIIFNNGLLVVVVAVVTVKSFVVEIVNR